MRIVKLIGLFAGVLAALFVLGGLMLPRVWRVERTAIINAPPEAIYPRLANFKRWQDWALPSEPDPDVENSYSGPVEGTGASWSWKGPKRGRGTMTLTRADPKAGIWVDEKIDGDDSNAHGSITFGVESTGTRVTWLDEGTLPPVVGGYFRRMVESMLGDHFQRGLERLKKITEQDLGVIPEEPAAAMDAGAADAG